MKNFPVNVDGKEYWISRSVAVVGFVYKVDENGEFYLLANKRGTGCPDFVGYWNIPCGYLDYDETISQAASREVYEEVGIKVPNYIWRLWFVNSVPTDNKQAVSFRFITKYEKDYGETTSQHCEPNEVSDIRWIKFRNINRYKWAFNQKEVVNNLVELMKKTSMHDKIVKGENLDVLFG